MAPSAAPAPAVPGDRIDATVVAATAAALVSLVLTSVALSPPASANRPEPTAGLESAGTFRHGGFDTSAVEVPAPGTGRAVVVDAQAGTGHVLVLGDPAQPCQVGTLHTPGAW